MIEAAFISDLHLNPNKPDITEKFLQFTQWASHHIKKLYILGDFFHVWAGDDLGDAWSDEIAETIANLTRSGVEVYYLHGNRDFLLGHQFASKANMTLLPDPYILHMHNMPILLTHGDQYCTRDRSHQWLRRLTRNHVFVPLFLRIPKAWRKKLVMKVRTKSQQGKKKPDSIYEVVREALLKQLECYQVEQGIHGHILKSGVTKHDKFNRTFVQTVLSDWDDTPAVLCYDSTKRLSFISWESISYVRR